MNYSDTVCDCTAIAANIPIEDRHFVERLDNGGWWFSVFDGHGGWQCSDYAHRKLHKNLQIDLNNYLVEAEIEEGDEEVREQWPPSLCNQPHRPPKIPCIMIP